MDNITHMELDLAGVHACRTIASPGEMTALGGREVLAESASRPLLGPSILLGSIAGESDKGK